MTKHLGRCEKGRKCYKTVYKYPFVKFNFVCAIKYGKIIGYKLYKKDKGGIDNIIKYKITKDHLKNYFNYLFIQANDYINKKS
jgi:hypothetical protein